MKRRDFLLALLVVVVWGANFTVIKLGLNGIPPMLLAALRYIFAALPAIAFVKKPDVSWKYIFAYGITVGVGQFCCLFYAMNIGMPAGVSSVVLQSQAFFTLIFAAVLLKEALKINQVFGLIIAGLGLCIIGGNIGVSGLESIPPIAFLLTLLAAAFWSSSNIVVKYAAKEAVSKGKTLNMFNLVVWGSLVPPVPFLIIALIVDTPSNLLGVISNLSAISIFSVFYLAFCATLFGYGFWSVLLSKYPTNKVAPLSMLVPVTGLIVSQVVLGEKLTTTQWIGASVIIMGLVIFNLGFSFIRRKRITDGN